MLNSKVYLDTTKSILKYTTLAGGLVFSQALVDKVMSQYLYGFIPRALARVALVSIFASLSNNSCGLIDRVIDRFGSEMGWVDSEVAVDE